MWLHSLAFKNNQRIPSPYTGEGHDISPPIAWSEVPKHCREFALICENPGNGNPLVHWLVFGISKDITFLPEGLPDVEKMSQPVAVLQGMNSFGNVGYEGPRPNTDGDRHLYIFTVYALNRKLVLRPGATIDEFRSAIEGHIIDSAQLVGLFERSRRAAG